MLRVLCCIIIDAAAVVNGIAIVDDVTVGVVFAVSVVIVVFVDNAGVVVGIAVVDDIIAVVVFHLIHCCRC